MDRNKIDSMLSEYLVKKVIDNSSYVLEYQGNKIKCIDLLGEDDTLEFDSIEQFLVYCLYLTGDDSFKILYGKDSLDFAKYIKGKLNVNKGH